MNNVDKTRSSKLPLKEIPGSYGLPFLGPILDRLSYFHTSGGRDAFFRSRIAKYGSTVFHTNMPPGPFISSDPRVIALLDASSFQALFDSALVDKKDVLFGTYIPSTGHTGGYRVLSYLDTAEPSHTLLKQLIFFMLSHRRHAVLGEFTRTFGAMFEDLESEIDEHGKADFNDLNDHASFSFLARALLGKDPLESELGSNAPKHFTRWVGAQMAPILSLGSPLLAIIEDLLLRTFPIPPCLVKLSYERLLRFFRDASGSVLDEAERLGIEREETVHNVTFAVCFNALGGIKILFPTIMKWIGHAGARLQAELAREVRSAVGAGGGVVSMKALEDMPLVRSVVYEVMRIEPPVPFQYARARKDLVIASHDARYGVKKGEMLFGYQPFATKDPRVFERAEEFVGDRFVGEEGERLVRHVLWSNGRETDETTPANKVCAGKDFVVLLARLLVVEVFMRYDSFEAEVKASPLMPVVTLTALKKAASSS